jgi:hypothetical protein
VQPFPPGERRGPVVEGTLSASRTHGLSWLGTGSTKNIEVAYSMNLRQLRARSLRRGRGSLDQNPRSSYTKIAVIRPGTTTLLMIRTLLTPLGTP